jgi:hypothetical protein
MKFIQRLSPIGTCFCQVRVFLFAVCLSIVSYVNAATYYVSPGGSDNAAGTLAQPFATLQKGNTVAVAGDTVFIRKGTYSITTPATSGAGITITKSGTSDTKRIYFWAYPGEVPVFDFSKMTISTSGYTHGIVVTGSWLHIKGLEICNTTMNINSNCGMHVDNTHDNIIELMNFHNNSGAGLFVSDTKGQGGHLILNCDSHDNYDPTGRQGDGQNADGFGVHYQPYGTGATTILRGCRSWWNSDDGYDFIYQEVPVIIEHCWAMGSGFANYGTASPKDGNGNGFKMGGSVNADVRHIIRNCVAWKNKANGFYANHAIGGRTWYNNTSLNNGTQYNMLAGASAGSVVLTGSLMHIMRNNIGFPNKNNNMIGTDSKFNTWDLNITPVAKDFLSITDPSVSGTGQVIETTSPAFGPRQADGSLPNIDFLKLAAGSQMIDKGTDVGVPYTGAAPDLGAYEYGAATQAITHPRTAFAKNIAVRTGPELKLGNLFLRAKPGVDKGQVGLYAVTGQRINPYASVKTGIYIEQLLMEKGR